MDKILIAMVIALVVLPPSLDPSIIIKEFQMGYRPHVDGKFWKGLRNAIIPGLLLWAVIAFVIWLIIR
jgi:hypothetical protein